jgi:hypothetical protein
VGDADVHGNADTCSQRHADRHLERELAQGARGEGLLVALATDLDP